MIRHLPNFLTCCNLVCGCFGIVFVLEGRDIPAAYFVWLAGAFDFFDGFAARMLKVTSSIGKELDSLADVVSFGVLPSLVMYRMISGASDSSALPYIAFAIVWAAAFGAPEQDDIAGQLGPVWSQILLIVILAPLAEEVCFRGMLFGGFRRRFRLPVAAIGAGLVFGVLHYSTGISAVPHLIVLGTIFALVYEKTRSLWPAIIFHMFNNAYALALLNA